MDNIKQYLKSLINVLPELPGVYLFYNDEESVIYVGKAKNLKKRVSSYFVKVPDNGKTRVLVKKIRDIKHVVVESEEDALLLENNLIKKYQPRYNILLKDDKSFPWIVIKNEPFPRVFQTRKVLNDGSLYFGPYTSSGMVKVLLELFRHLYPVRTCNYNLSQENILKKKYKVCLEYHLGNCKAPCIGAYSESEYNKDIKQIKDILKGNISYVIKYLKDLMQQYSLNLEFEKAADIKKRLDSLKNYRAKSTVVNPKMNDVDVFSYTEDDNAGYVNYLKIVNGAIIQSHTMEFRKKLNETGDEIIQMAITEIRERTGKLAREVLVPFIPSVIFSESKFLVPKIGDKKKLLELSERNVKYYRLEKLKQLANNRKLSRENRILETMKQDLRLNELPYHIECFDNSNIQGYYPVAACVVFKNAKPAKKEYRHFNIKTVKGPNDFASMEEVVYRRYKRLIEEEKELPQLIIIDGGKGQLGAALNSLRKLNLHDKIAVIGIAKRLEELFYPGDPIPLYLDKNSETLKVIQNLRNEAHRFGITFHRNKRSKDFIKTELQNIPGVGEKTIKALYEKFGSVNNIKDADEEEISEVIGKSKGKQVFNALKEEVNKTKEL